MSLDSAIARARQADRRVARSTCTITRSGTEAAFDPETGTYTEAAGDLVYTGWCTVRPEGREGVDTEAGETELRLNDYTVKVEANTPAWIDDIVTVTTSPDEGLVGKRLRVTDVPVDDWQVSRRLVVEEVT